MFIKVKVPDNFDSEKFSLHLTERSNDRNLIIVNDAPVEAVLMTANYQTVLDHGFVGLVDFMGDDGAIAEAARVSYQRGTKKTRGVKDLIRYLLRHDHSTPFEMAEAKYHVKGPIFVFRQWHRHRTASINEMSARYSVLDNEMYVPAYEDAAPQSLANKQGRQNALTMADYLAVVAAMEQINSDSYGTYQYLLGQETKVVDGVEQTIRFPPPDAINLRKTHAEVEATNEVALLRKFARDNGDEFNLTPEGFDEIIQRYYEKNGLALTSAQFPGIARELARMVLPVSTYSQMYWKTNLWNLFRFLNLRMDAHAQKEIRVYANAMYEQIRPIFPHSCKAFEDYIHNSWKLSRMDTSVILRLVHESWRTDHTPEWIRKEIGPELGMSGREIEELIVKLKPGG